MIPNTSTRSRPMMKAVSLRQGNGIGKESGEKKWEYRSFYPIYTKGWIYSNELVNSEGNLKMQYLD